ncbi:hypothetical protein M0R36_10775 [bacterium]|jgi:hypothetical protein|nr:hypothetical protein [bacterium]
MNLILPKHECSLTLTHNIHKDYYRSAKEHIEEMESVELWDLDDWVSPEERRKAMDTNEIWQLDWYPDTPVGYNKIMASSLRVIMEYIEKNKEVFGVYEEK